MFYFNYLVLVSLSIKMMMIIIIIMMIMLYEAVKSLTKFIHALKPQWKIFSSSLCFIVDLLVVIVTTFRYQYRQMIFSRLDKCNVSIRSTKNKGINWLKLIQEQKNSSSFTVNLTVDVNTCVYKCFGVSGFLEQSVQGIKALKFLLSGFCLVNSKMLFFNTIILIHF